jgi:hypothetical protein
MAWEGKPPDKKRKDKLDELKHEERDVHTNRKIKHEQLQRIERMDQREILDFGEEF